MADHFLNGVQEYIKDHKDQPFFLYYPMQQPHVLEHLIQGLKASLNWVREGMP